MPALLRRPIAACALLLAVYVGLSFLNDPRGYLGTDTGGKVATLKVMTERGHLDPGVGYWAERWDPEARVHPLYYTFRVGDRWVQATTLPVLYAASPLFALGGYRLALLIPMVGSVLAALAARALVRRLSTSDGSAAFWIVGLASPLTIYALDFWEHSVGVAAVAWAVVLLADVVEGRRGWPAAAGAGALFGAAATMRTEALVYAFVAVALACLVLLLVRHRAGAAVATGAIATASMLVPLILNHALEVATVGEGIRFGRASGTASSAVSTVGEVAGTRVEEAVLTAASLNPALLGGSYLIGIVLLALLAFVALRASRSGDIGPAILAAVGVSALYLIRFADGLGFVPGLAAATPLAVIGVVLAWSSPPARYFLGVALVALPIVWATQYQGGAPPQWAGRYILASGLLLGAVGVSTLPRLRPWAGRGAVVLAVAVTTFGLAWTSTRSHQIARAEAALTERPEPVLVSRIAHLAREGGAFYGDRRWLTAVTADDQRFALEVLGRAGVTSFGLVDLDLGRPPVDIPGWHRLGRDRLALLSGVNLVVTTYEAG